MILLEGLKQLDRAIGRVAMAVAGALFVGIGIAFLGQIVLRYLFNVGLVWVDEFARYSLVWVVFLSAGLGFPFIEATSVRIVVNLLPRAGKRGVTLVTRLLSLATLVTIFWYGIQFTNQGTLIRMLGLSPLSMFWAHLAIPVGCSVMILRLTRMIICDFVSRGEEGKL
jgi:TRAP-type C4-dicarboxylate transport system permease small subunit